MAIGASDKTAFALALGQDAPPGDVWAYNNSAIQTLSAVLEAATGEDPVDYARTQLFEPLGMADSTLTTDAAGNALTFMGLRTTCLDLARFGYLMLRDGVWDGEQVVSSDYVEQATGRSSTELNAAYGLLWWLNREGIDRHADPRHDRDRRRVRCEAGPARTRRARRRLLGARLPQPDRRRHPVGGHRCRAHGRRTAARGAVHPGRADHGRARRGGRAMTERSEVAAADGRVRLGLPARHDAPHLCGARRGRARAGRHGSPLDRGRPDGGRPQQRHALRVGLVRPAHRRPDGRRRRDGPRPLLVGDGARRLHPRGLRLPAAARVRRRVRAGHP